MSNDLPGHEGILEGAVREALAGAGPAGLEPDDLAAAVGAEPASEDLTAATAELERSGWAAFWNQRWFSVRHTRWVTGRIRKGRGGEYSLASGERGEVGYEVAKSALQGAREGDLVLARPLKGRGGKRPRGLPGASVVKVLERRVAARVGFLDEGRWVAYEPKDRLELDIEGDRPPDRVWVVVDAPRTGKSGRVTGRVAEVLGRSDEPEVDLRVVLEQYEIREPFPAEVLQETGSLPEDPLASDFDGREDLRDVLTITVDGPTARDFDDAISLRRAADGFELGVHIADVAHYVKEGSAVDLEAYRRGTSVYFPERAVPMLPENLSNGLCSLRPGVPRLAQSAFLSFDGAGEMTGRRFADTVIRSDRRMTYDEVRRLLEEPARRDATEYGAVLPLLERSAELMRILLRRRLERGSLDFDLPEGDVVLDEEGATVGVRPSERNVAHRIIEEFMIAANEAVSAELEGHAVPALYRTHLSPDLDRLEELRVLLEPFGLRLPEDLTALQPRHLQAVLEAVEGKEEEPFVSTVVLRTMQRAMYETEPKGHYALATRHYSHFTSPIRRYPDLLAHRQLRALRADPKPEAQADLAARLATIAEHCSTTERRAERAERQLLRWKLVRLMAKREGETFKGRITGVQPFGLFVELEGHYVDGLVPIRTMSDDFYVFEPESRRLVGSDAGRTFQLANPVDVKLQRADIDRRMLDLVIAGMPARDRRSGGRGRR